MRILSKLLTLFWHKREECKVNVGVFGSSENYHLLEEDIVDIDWLTYITSMI